MSRHLFCPNCVAIFRVDSGQPCFGCGDTLQEVVTTDEPRPPTEEEMGAMERLAQDLEKRKGKHLPFTITKEKEGSHGNSE